LKTPQTSRSELETRTLARAFAETLRRGDVVALYGELGSGKTQFVKGVCEAFGVGRHVASPTFIIQNRYDGSAADGTPMILYHFDLYRIERVEEIYDLGYEEFLFGDGICMIEWAERLGPLLPANRYDVSFSFGEEDQTRLITIDAVGSGHGAGERPS